jgi:hypothetical protein
LKYGVPKERIISGDCANPQDIIELNLAFERIGSPYRVAGVAAETKSIKVGIERTENLLNRGAFKVRRSLGAGSVWKLGMSASRGGKPVEGSRWVWEANNWQYPKTDDDKVQKDVPDDQSADGADMMAATRYLVMTWWGERPEAPRVPSTVHEMDNVHPGMDYRTGYAKEHEPAVPTGIIRYTVPTFRTPRYRPR